MDNILVVCYGQLNYLGEQVMYQDEKLICEDCGCEFVLQQANKNFMLKKV